MSKILVLLENDSQITKEDHAYTYNFKERFLLENPSGEVIELTNLKAKDRDIIKTALISATDIAAQTCLVNGSEDQFTSIVALLSMIPIQKNIHISLLGDSLHEYISENLSDKEIYGLRKHHIFELKRNKSVQIDLTKQISRFQAELDSTQQKIDKTAKTFTGRKIKIINCYGYGKAFQNLPIGEVVDELDGTLIDPNSSRGVWVMGNGEPIKLINDCGKPEYEVVTKLSPTEIAREIKNGTPIDLSLHENDFLESLVSDCIIEGEDSLVMANIICEEYDIEKRKNRQVIIELLDKNK